MAAENGTPPGGLDLRLDDDDLALWDELSPGEEHTLVELINRVLDKGVVIVGDVTLSVAGVDLVYLSLNALLTSVSTARRVIDPRIPGGERPGEG